MSEPYHDIGVRAGRWLATQFPSFTIDHITLNVTTHYRRSPANAEDLDRIISTLVNEGTVSRSPLLISSNSPIHGKTEVQILVSNTYQNPIKEIRQI